MFFGLLDKIANRPKIRDALTNRTTTELSNSLPTEPEQQQKEIPKEPQPTPNPEPVKETPPPPPPEEEKKTTEP